MELSIEGDIIKVHFKSAIEEMNGKNSFKTKAAEKNGWLAMLRFTEKSSLEIQSHMHIITVFSHKASRRP